MRILAIETTCDETAAAVVASDLRVLSSVVASQDELHGPFRGVVPEIAARAHVERILPVIDEALRRANTRPEELHAVAVAVTPGLAGSLLVGLMAAKSLCWALDKPLVAVNHLHAHVYACQIAAGRNLFPCVGMIVSGGHTNLFRCAAPTEFEYLGGTIDDAAGEAFDKVASMLGLPYPGGPALAQAASRGRADAFDFPRSLLNDDSRLDFSFSGLKTAVRYELVGPGAQQLPPPDLTADRLADVAASFQAAVVDCLVGKAVLAVGRCGFQRLCVGGGVAANQRFRAQLAAACRQQRIELHVAPPELCTDNAVMGAIAFEHLRAGKTESLDLDITPGLVRHR